MSLCHVITTINKPTAVACAAKGHFLDPVKDSIVVCKGSTVEVHDCTFKKVKEFSIYGTIQALQIINIPGYPTSTLFILTDQCYFTIVLYSVTRDAIMTLGHGHLNSISKTPNQFICATVDNMILVSLFSGSMYNIPFYLIPHKHEKLFEPLLIRTYEFDIIAMEALNGALRSSFAVLVGAKEELKKLKIFNYADGELFENEKCTTVAESTAHMLAAVPDPIGGVLIIGEYIISYYDASCTTKEISINPILITAYTFLNNSCKDCILADSSGHLHLLTLRVSNMKVSHLDFTTIGQVPIPDWIIDLGKDMLYLGSAQDDSCILRLLHNHSEIEIVRTFSNLGPITDFCLYDYERQGKKTMVCCSGSDTSGTLRILENGVDYKESYNFSYPFVKNVWSFGNDLVISTCFETMILNMTTAGKKRLSGIPMGHEPTLSLCMTTKGYILHVTASRVRLFGHDSMLDEWKPPIGEVITIAETNETRCILCYGTGVLVHLEVIGTYLMEMCTSEFLDISCISISDKKENRLGQSYVLISMWTRPEVYILELTNFNIAYQQKLDDGSCVNDLLIVVFEDIEYLLILMGNGILLSYVIENMGTLSSKRQTIVGTYCTGMYSYVHQGQQRVFIAGNRATIITSFKQTLQFFTVNTTETIYAFTAHHNELVMITKGGLSFGDIDEYPKLHHMKIKLDTGAPNQVEFMEFSRCLAVSTIKNVRESGILLLQSSLHILDTQTYSSLDVYHFPVTEFVKSITVATFDEYPNKEYLFVGTFIEDPQEAELTEGKISVFQVQEKKLKLIESVHVAGPVFDMKVFNNSVIACVSGSIHCLSIFNPDLPMGKRVLFNKVVDTNVLALTMDTVKDKVLVGHLMQSLSVLSVTKKDPIQLKIVAFDRRPLWITAVKFVNEHVYLGADDHNNLYTLSLEDNYPNNGNILKLELKGGFHVGSLVNCLKEGILSYEKEEDRILMENSITFVTFNGGIYTIKTISGRRLEFFNKLQQCIVRESENIGQLNYDFKEDTVYIDGDILKRYHKGIELKNEPLLSKYNSKEIEDLINSLVS